MRRITPSGPQSLRDLNASKPLRELSRWAKRAKLDLVEMASRIELEMPAPDSEKVAQRVRDLVQRISEMDVLIEPFISRGTTRVFTIRDLAERWSCSEKQVGLLIKSGELRAFRIGQKLWRVSVEEVERYEDRSTGDDSET